MSVDILDASIALHKIVRFVSVKQESGVDAPQLKA